MLRDDAPLIVTGMHRSGTSMVASLLHAAGISMGEHLLGPGAGNESGHFEDLDFLHLHKTFLQNQELHPAGWIVSDEVTPGPADTEIARQLLAKKLLPGKNWGWKDPRTTLFIDFWNHLAPEAGWIFLYRLPWDVVDSLARRGADPELAKEPVLSVLTWISYNNAILRFIRANRNRCLLVCADAVAARPKEFLTYVNATFGVEIAPVNTAIINPRILRGNAPDSWQAETISAISPDSLAIFEELQGESQMKIPSPGKIALEPMKVGVALLQRWIGYQRLATEREAAAQLLSEAQRVVDWQKQQIEELQGRLNAIGTTR